MAIIKVINIPLPLCAIILHNNIMTRGHVIVLFRMASALLIIMTLGFFMIHSWDDKKPKIIKDISPCADNNTKIIRDQYLLLMEEGQEKYLDQVLAEFDLYLMAKDFLPYKNKIQQKKVLAIDNTILRKFIKIMHKKTLSSSKDWWQINPYDFFIHLKTNTVYNYVILENELIIACTARSQDNFYKNKFSKHYFISGLKNNIYYGGQIMTYMKDEKIIVLLNNASGTYKPHDQDLPQVINLLKYNFGDHDYLIFKAKSFNKPIYQEDVN